MLTQLTIFLYIVIFLYGIVIGSFLNVLIFRIPKKENIVQSSHCMNCGRKLGWRDMVPVFSYIILRGRCRQCGARISIQYPLIEALNGVLYVVVFMAGGFTFSSVLYCLMTSALIVIAVIDERTYQIPVSQNLFLGLLGIIMTVYDFRHILSHIIGAVIVSLFLYGLFLLRQSNRWGRHQTHGICRPAFRRKKHYFCIYSCMHSWIRHPYHPHESKQAKQPACTRSVPFGRHIHRRTLGQPFLDLVSRHDGHLLKHGMNCYVWHN